MHIFRLLNHLPDWCHLCHLSWQYWDGESERGQFLEVRHPSTRALRLCLSRGFPLLSEIVTSIIAAFTMTIVESRSSRLVLSLCASPPCLLTSLAGTVWLQRACQACKSRRAQWRGATTQAKFDASPAGQEAKKVSKERGWGWGELERVGGREGFVERGIENGRGKREGERERERDQHAHTHTLTCNYIHILMHIK